MVASGCTGRRERRSGTCSTDSPRARLARRNKGAVPAKPGEPKGPLVMAMVMVLAMVLWCFCSPISFENFRKDLTEKNENLRVPIG